MMQCLDSPTLDRRIRVAMGAAEADLVLKQAVVPNLFTNEMITADVAIVDGYVAGIGEYSGREEIDCQNQYVCPAFIDGHVHIESTMALPGEFARAVVPHGTLTAIADPHEIANVCGLQGIRFFIDETERLPMTVYFMAPSCVPATPLEYNGAALGAADLAQLLGYPRVLGLGEVMDYLAVVQGNEEMLQKISAFRLRPIDGHLSGVFGHAACAYASAGIQTNHECSTMEEVLEYLRLGMYIQVRQGSSAKNLEMILAAARRHHVCLDRLFFCTDDKHLDDIRREGHIVNNVRKALDLGFSIYDALRMASLNAARCYGLKDVGAVAPGYRADLLVLSDIHSLAIEKVIQGGVVVSSHGSEPGIPCPQPDGGVRDTVHIAPVSLKDLELGLVGDRANVISVIPAQLVTRLEKERVCVRDGRFVPDREFSKVAVIERHHATGKIGLGIVRGFGIENAAIASTVAHDSHNLIVAGDNDRDMMAAIEAVQQSGGGIYLVSGGQILGGLPLPIAGLMSDLATSEVTAGTAGLTAMAYRCGVSGQIEPLGMLSFLSLPVIPEGRITPDGLYDVLESRFISVST